MKLPKDEALQECEEKLGYKFGDRSFLLRALTHASAKSDAYPSNERLEFLGDSILGMIVSALLFAEFTEHDEGRMTKIKAQAVSRSSLLAVAKVIGLQDYLIVGKMFEDRDSISDSIQADAVEALIAAVYLDGGFDVAIDFVVEHFKAAVVDAARSPGQQDFKSLLGQWAQKEFSCNPAYRVLDVNGPDHELVFLVEVSVGSRDLARAEGGSKKSAEQEAARIALEEQGLR